MQRRHVLSLFSLTLGILGFTTTTRHLNAMSNSPKSNIPSSIPELWQTLEAWLQQHLPELLADLNPGCTDDQLAALEQRLGCQLPEDFKAFYKIHNGQQDEATGLFFGLPYLSLEAIDEQWSMWQELSTEDFANEMTGTAYPEGAIIPTYINLKWIPLTEDGSGNHLGIDLDPGPTGTLGQIINFGPDEIDRFAIAPSLTAFLRWMLDQYQSGNFTITFKPDYGRRILTIREPAYDHFQDALPQLFGN
jgi:cell wall assembly regulator SMI1